MCFGSECERFVLKCVVSFGGVAMAHSVSGAYRHHWVDSPAQLHGPWMVLVCGDRDFFFSSGVKAAFAAHPWAYPQPASAVVRRSGNSVGDKFLGGYKNAYRFRLQM